MKRISRKDALTSLIVLPALAGTMMAAARAADDNKAQFKYQDHPNGKQQCSGCALFVPGKSGDDGTCRVVKGAISSHGWCTAYSAKD